MFKKTTFILILIIFLGAFFRFYKLDWGNGLYTHPDEYHIVIAVEQLNFPTQMNPNFFSYGTVTIYLIYFTRVVLNFFHLPIDPFLIGRFYSAIFATLTILVVYKITKFLANQKIALVAALLISLTPGLIQQAHFTTPESNLIFFILASLLFIMHYLKKPTLTNLFLSSIFLGLALGTKVSSLFFSPVIFLAILWDFKSKGFIKIISHLIFAGIVIFLTFFIVDPYVFLDFSHFKSNLVYESSLAAGDFVVFYTRQYVGTIPFLFQLEKIYPVTLGIILPFGILGFILSIFKIFKKESKFDLFLAFGFLLILIPNSFLFAKWTRFVSPTLPFFAIFSALFIKLILDKNYKIGKIISLVLIFGSIIWSLAFFSIYINTDIRISTDKWMQDNLSPGSSVLVEEGNTVEVPLGGNLKRTGFDFYSLEDTQSNQVKLATDLENADYFVVESRRLFADLGVKNSYPATSQFYKLLFNGGLGFTKIAEFNSFPSLKYLSVPLEFPDETAEETWSVFDHPVIRIYQKTQSFSTDDYLNILQNNL